MMYKQCKFKKDNSFQTAWIEERGAIIGKHVELKSCNNERWEVVSVSPVGLSSAQLHTFNEMHRVHRNGSDI